MHLEGLAALLLGIALIRLLHKARSLHVNMLQLLRQGSKKDADPAALERLADFTPPPGETREQTRDRYLRAHGTPASAAAKLEATIAWRRSHHVDELRAKPGAEALGCDVIHLQRVLPHALPGTRSKRGLPLIFKHFGGQCALKRALEHTTVDHLYTYNTWLNEQYTNALAEAGVSQWVVVIDAAGWNPGLVDSTAIAWLKNMADTDKEHYPERLGAIVVVNAPWLLAGLWRIIQTWLDEPTKQKVAIISEKAPEQARARLREIADDAALPAQYGGTGAPLENWPERSGVPRE